MREPLNSIFRVRTKPFQTSYISFEPPRVQASRSQFLPRHKRQFAFGLAKPERRATGRALKDLKNNTKINLKKADKDTTMFVMNKEDKIKEGRSQLDNTDHYQPLDHPMVVETAGKVTSLIEDLYDGQFIDETTMEWLLQTPKPPRVPEFYTLTKIHKPKPVGRLISGCDGPTERISAFVDKLIQPSAKIQKSYIKDTTDFILHQFHRTQKASTKHATSYNGCN